jgi:hypothetical protein
VLWAGASIHGVPKGVICVVITVIFGKQSRHDRIIIVVISPSPLLCCCIAASHRSIAATSRRCCCIAASRHAVLCIAAPLFTLCWLHWDLDTQPA